MALQKLTINGIDVLSTDGLTAKTPAECDGVAGELIQSNFQKLLQALDFADGINLTTEGNLIVGGTFTVNGKTLTVESNSIVNQDLSSDASPTFSDVVIDEGSVAALIAAAASSGTITIEANTAVAASPNIITSSESGKLFTNEGVAAKNYHTLPTAVAGLNYQFYVQDSNGIRIVSNTGDKIRLYDNVTITAGYIESTTVGSAIQLIAINNTEWIVSPGAIGTWVLETS